MHAILRLAPSNRFKGFKRYDVGGFFLGGGVAEKISAFSDTDIKCKYLYFPCFCDDNTMNRFCNLNSNTYHQLLFYNLIVQLHKIV